MNGLFLNFFEFLPTKDTVTINYLPYNKDCFKQLIDDNKNRGIYFYKTFSSNEERIYYWKLSPDFKINNDLEGKEITINLKKEPKVFSKIIERALIEYLKKNLSEKYSNYNIYESKYSHTFNIVNTKDQLENKIEGLIIQQKTSLSNYFFKEEKQNYNIIFGILISFSLKQEFTYTIKDFEKLGIDTNSLKVNNEKIYANLQSIKKFLTVTNKEHIYNSKINILNKNSYKFEHIIKIFEYLEKRKNEIYLLDNSIDKIIMSNSIKNELISYPKRYYYNGITNNETNIKYNEQVKKYKPFSFEVFNNKQINIGVISPKEYKSTVDIFVKELESKLKNDFHLKNLKVEEISFINDDYNEYKNIIYKNDKLLKSDVILVILNEEHKKLNNNLSPYYTCKAKLIGIGIPTQDITIETIKKMNEFILNNISLNIYAKLGGTAWTIQKEETQKQELIIGISSTKSKDGKQIIGIAQIFHSDGKYLVGDCVPLSNYDNYKENLENYLYNALNNVINNQINKNYNFRLIFHLFKLAGKEFEINAIENVIKKFRNLSFDYALVHLSYGHNFRMFFNRGEGELKKGLYVKLDSNTILISFIPKSIIPLKVFLDKRSTFKDILHITKLIYCFSHLSYRSYTPSKKTVTLLYPSLMSNITEKLKQVDGWDHDRLININEKLWFI